MDIIIVDDDFFVTTALKTILEASKKVTVLATGTDGEDAVSLYRNHHPDILLTDIQMKKKSGLEATEEILSEFPNAKILLLTTFSDDEYIVKALKLGAKGYLLKQDYESILPALEAVGSGQSVFGTEIVSKIPELLQSSSSFDYSAYGISEKEIGIIQFVADGYSNKEIASKLFLSEGTVRNYLSTILEKLELRDRTQLAVFYYQHR
ncbi:MAG: response regulator transcription factor [Lachnospiraceae bacterium]|jgi:Response regulator containing a CheY-like receiver domain and an HTH DNA-binding domain|nr:response regulator transcription factor [Lachnospiraceae bacterium]